MLTCHLVAAYPRQAILYVIQIEVYLMHRDCTVSICLSRPPFPNGVCLTEGR
jgi:hypothetical protein